MEHPSFIKDGVIVAHVDAKLFSREAVVKTLYWFGDKFLSDIQLTNEHCFRIQLKPLQSAQLKEEDLEFYLLKFQRDLIDFDLREIVHKETANVRSLLVAKAFSNGEFDEDPPGEVSDSVGFSPAL